MMTRIARRHFFAVQHRGQRRGDAGPDPDAAGRAILRMEVCHGPGRDDLSPRRPPLVLDRPGRAIPPGMTPDRANDPKTTFASATSQSVGPRRVLRADSPVFGGRG